MSDEIGYDASRDRVWHPSNLPISLIAPPRTQRIRPRAAFSAGFFIPLNFTGSEPLEPLALI